MAENIRCFCPEYPTNIQQIIYWFTKLAPKCEYPDIRIWANPLICSKIAKYPISESIIIYPNGVANARNIPKYPLGYGRGLYLVILIVMLLSFALWCKLIFCRNHEVVHAGGKPCSLRFRSWWLTHSFPAWVFHPRTVCRSSSGGSYFIR